MLHALWPVGLTLRAYAPFSYWKVQGVPPTAAVKLKDKYLTESQLTANKVM